MVVDLRSDSPTFGQWDAAELSLENGKSIYVSAGLGHGFLNLEEGSVSNYLCSTEYDPVFDKGVNPLSASLEIPFQRIAEQNKITSLIISERDAKAPFFYPK